jgi:hypothetical protein
MMSKKKSFPLKKNIKRLSGNNKWNWITMLNKTRSFLEKTRKLLLIPLFWLFVAVNAFKMLSANRKKILFCMDDERLYDDGAGRHPYLLANAFSEAGYTVFSYKKIRFSSFARLGCYGRYSVAIKNMKFISKLPSGTKEMICAFDGLRPEIMTRRWKKLVYVNVLKPVGCQVGEPITVPFFMHPLIYFLKKNKKLESYRLSRRSVRVFFGGNMTKDIYNNQRLKQQGHITRHEAITALLASCLDVKVVKDEKELTLTLGKDQYLNACRLLEGRTSALHWLKLIARSDFFLCFSGTDYPLCHNAIEAMAVGTIPIISYYDWFDPPLEHTKNAIVFSEADDLVEKVRDVLAMSFEEIKKMRNEVILYYGTYLSPKGFVGKFESSDERLNTLLLYPKLVTSGDENQKTQVFLQELERLKERV